MSIVIVKLFMGQPLCDKNGYVTLISILVVGAIGVSIAISLLLLGISSARNSIILEQSSKAKYMADICIEEGIRQIRELNSFSGGNTFNFASNTCGYLVIDGGGENRVVQASSTVGSAVRKVKVEIDQISPTINVSSWQEVADF